ncbi:hypothetical protein SBRCBS47491_006638 [Sporothrix bragantina]|uniref:Uncharacterized protein n=1 Tax=Sporothrix bragantina TaxID=671064 RepID=A0ABP0C6K0_9PEZI
MDTDDAPDETGALSSLPSSSNPNANPALRPDRDLFQGRAQPFTFTVTHRERPTSPLSSSANTDTSTTAVASPQASPRRNPPATVQRHVTRALVLDPSFYAGHSRYSQRQFDEEAASQDANDNNNEDHDHDRELALDLDMELELLREHRAHHNNRRHRRQQRQHQGPFVSMSRATCGGGDGGGHGAVRKVCQRRSLPQVVFRRSAHAHASAHAPKPTLCEEPMVSGCTPAWKVWSALSTLPLLRFHNLKKLRDDQGEGDRPEIDNAIRFYGIILADPTILASPHKLPDVRTLLIKTVTQGPMRWQWSADGTRQPPWALPNVATLSLSPTTGESMDTDDNTTTTSVAPAPCGPEDTAFWTWLARQVARFYAPHYAERIQNASPLLRDQKGAMAFRIISDNTDGEDVEGVTHSGRDGNSSLAIGRNLQQLVELLIRARQDHIKAALLHSFPAHTSAPLPDDEDMDADLASIDPWAPFDDICRLLIASDAEQGTVGYPCLALALDAFCMWREQGRPGQPGSSYPPWTETMHPHYQGLQSWVQKYRRGLAEQQGEEEQSLIEESPASMLL